MSLAQKIEAVRAVLARVDREYTPAAFANSFGAEDMVLTDLIAREFPAIEIFTLDTGRLPQETYDLMRAVAERFDINVRVYFPETEAVQDYVSQHGPNAFFDSVTLRRRCCAIRKIEPLARALAGKRAWITGLRRAQSITRADLPMSEFDHDNGLEKFNPLYDWSEGEVWSYLKRFDVPYNVLHDRGYASIGCAPCTRAITVGEDVRAGRWWWENPGSRECGLHRNRSTLTSDSK
jgi:phosphoadenosine phosphosulfate reductase